jgi:signal transduction histidine kinase
MPLRARLVLGFSLAMVVVLLAVGGFVYWRVEFAMDRSLDRDLAQATEALAPLVTSDGTVTDHSAVASAGVVYQVLDAEGHVLSGSATRQPLVAADIAHSADSGQVRADRGKLLPVSADPLRFEVSALPTSSRPAAYLVVGVRRDQRDEALRELLLQLVLAGLGALVVTAFVGDRLARAALTPVERYRGRAEEIAAGTNGLRLSVPPDRDDEVTRLGHTLNEMLAALEAALEHERRFVNDASHELRTPLTLLTSRVQLARRRTRTVAEHEAILAELEVDVRRLSALAERLLQLGSVAGEETGDADLALAARAAVQRHQVAGEHRIGVAAPSPAPVALPRHRLDRLIENLLDNALKHGDPPIEVTVDSRNGWVRLRVVDDGPGMSPALLASATQRFARADEARSRPGSGLGLALVEALVGSSGGQLRLCSGGNHQLHGARVDIPCDHDDRMTVTVLLPLSSGRVSA